MTGLLASLTLHAPDAPVVAPRAGLLASVALHAPTRDATGVLGFLALRTPAPPSGVSAPVMYVDTDGTLRPAQVYLVTATGALARIA